MTREEAIEYLNTLYMALAVFPNQQISLGNVEELKESVSMAIQALSQEPIDKSAMMYEIYMEGVNMSGEYQGCWVRFKDIKKIVDKYMGDKE